MRKRWVIKVVDLTGVVVPRQEGGRFWTYWGAARVMRRNGWWAYNPNREGVVVILPLDGVQES